MRARRMFAVAAICALALSAAPLAPGEGKALAREDTADISVAMNAFYYAPGERAYLDVDLELSGEARTTDIQLDLRIYPAATTRSQLSSFREGTRRPAIFRRSLETIKPDSRWVDKMYEIDLAMLGLGGGVYPFEVRLLGAGEVIKSDQNYLVIMDPASGYPLNLSLLWTLDFLPRRDALGGDLDGELAAACSSAPEKPGFLYALTRAMKKTPEVRGNMVVCEATWRDIASLGEGDGRDGPGSAQEGASEVLSGLAGLIEAGQLDLLATTYAFADPDALASRGWEGQETEGGEREGEAERQMRLGLEFARRTAPGGRGFVAPLFRLSDLVLQYLVGSGVEYAVVGREALQYSPAGERLLEGMTLAQPVRFVSRDGYALSAFLHDEAIYAYLENTGAGDVSHVVQTLFAELAVLQRERPYEVRSCVLAFPSAFVPPQDFAERFYEAVRDCPWLQTRRLSELSADQFPLKGVALPAPSYPPAASDYLLGLEAARNDLRDFAATIPAGHSLREDLTRTQLIAENYRFAWGRDGTAALAYLKSMDAVIRAETAKVNIELKHSVTLSSTEGKLSVDVTSGLDYPLQGVTLRLDNANMTFPEGSAREVVIEPRENHYIFQVDARRKGSFIVDIVLESGDLLIDSTSTTVNTSIINTLAIILLAGLALLVAMAIAVRRLLGKYRGGKHARGRGGG